jgi:nucleoside-diphosphate-sugar epimerase
VGHRHDRGAEAHARPRPAGRTILLTGASGVVGRALLPSLARSTTICLVHRTPVEGPNVIALPGDVARRYFGLPRFAFDDLARRIDCVVHAAAVTSFADAADVVHRTNVDGTEHALELAARAKVPLYHVSTAFVEPPERTASGYPAPANQAPTDYELSKQAAERMVRQSGLPNAIMRPSLVVGDSATGQIAQFQGIYMILGLVLRGLLPVLPSPAWSRVDFVPQDVVADGIAGLIERRALGEYWLTSGERALTVGEIGALCVAHAERLVGRRIEPVRLVAPELFERLIRPVFLPAFPSRTRRMLERALQLSRYTALERPFPSSLPEMERTLGVPPLPPPATSLLRSLAYWAKAARRSGVAEQPDDPTTEPAPAEGVAA